MSTQFPFRKLSAVSLIAFLLLSMSAIAAHAQSSAGPFPDVSGDHENITAIQFLKDNGVFTGYPDGTFQPDRVLNRAEQLKVYMLLHGIDPSVSTYKNCFPDVKEEWFARFVCFAKFKGWVKGYPDGTFKPGQSVNKAEALKMLGEIQGWDMPDPTSAPFADVPANAWYAKYVAFAKAKGLLSVSGDTFDPAGGLSRAATAELLFRSLAVFALGKNYSPSVDVEILQLNLQNLSNLVPGLVTPVAEFGDAPDGSAAGYVGIYSSVTGNFPTYYNTTNTVYGLPGAHALDSSQEWLGDPSLNESYSYEEDADDPSDPDGIMNLVNTDKYDDGVKGLNVTLVSIPPPATLTFDVTVASGAPDVPRYVNVLIDLNMDGKWAGAAAGGEPEWVMKNFVVNVDPGTTKRITTSAFAYANGLILTPTAWMRVVLSRAPIDASVYGAAGWDGTGQFEKGEVEDYFIQLPPIGDGTDGGGGGIIWGKPAPVMVCPRRVNFPPNVNVVRYMCMIFNFGGRGAVAYNWAVVVPGVAVAPIFGNLIMPTAPPGFPPFGVVGNPTPRWFTAIRGTTPSTWKYTIVGIDPESTVTNSVISLGLVPGDKDEGYDASDTYDDLYYWASEVNDAYLYENPSAAILPPRVLALTVFQLSADNASVNEYKVVAHVRNPGGKELQYAWTSPAGCGFFEKSGDSVVWEFPNDEESDACKAGGLTLTVNGADGNDSVTFTGMFGDIVVPPPASENEPPVVEGVVYEKGYVNEEDNPHIYYFSVIADDPEGTSLTYDWTNITCGSFVGSTSQQSVEWNYDPADIAQCSSAQFTVIVTDEDGQSTTHTQTVFQ